MTKPQKKSPRSFRLTFCKLAFASLSLVPAAANAADWINTGAGAFNQGANWSTGVVPNDGSTQANIANGGTATIAAGDSFNTGLFTVGNAAGTGFITQTGGGITSSQVIVGGDANGSGETGVGSYTISGGSLTSTSGNEMYFGSRGATGTLNASGNAVISNANYLIFGRDGGTGNGTLSGTATLSTTANNIAIGVNSNGRSSSLTAGGSSTVSSANELYVGWLGDNTNQGTFTIRDSAKVSVVNGLVVGRDGALGTMSISNNATVNVGGAFIAGADGVGNGTITINDAANVTSSWMAAGLTNGSQGTITINGGTVTTTSTSGQTQGVMFDAATAGTKALNLNGGVLQTNTFLKYDGNTAVQISFNGGTIRSTADNTNFFAPGTFIGTSAGFTSADMSINSGGLTFDTNSHAVGITQALPGSGGLTKIGTGTLTLSGANTFTGITTVSGGTLTLAATTGAALSGTSRVTAQTGGILQFAANNQINATAPVVLNGGQMAFAAGNFSQGSLSIVGVGALTLQSTASLDFANGNELLHFAASGGASWAAGSTLSVYNWTGGSDHLLFGTGDNATSLTATQLSQIKFYSDNGTTFLGQGAFAGNRTGELTYTAVPEPSTLASALVFALCGGVLYARKRLHGPLSPAA